jgi:hypothetical protein
MMTKAVREQEQINLFFEHAPENLGPMFKEYIEESSLAGWDGFDQNEQTAVRRMLLDFILFTKYRD